MKKIELLAPVKDKECLQAVIASGADSIYMGYQFFNARMFGKNFTESEFKENILYAHTHNVKVYLTLNTLIREDEMSLAVKLANQAIYNHVDAILVQDIGLASEILKHIPEATIHASTQMSVCNHYGVKILHELGYQRIVLARELNHREIVAIKRLCLNSDSMHHIEVEAFIHGGLCIAYSGQCFSSSYCYGSSANRGRCLMTCWKGYKLRTEKKILEKGSLLRPRDLEGLQVLRNLIEGEIDCLKIQGRLRNCKYISEIVDVYRNSIDAILETKTDSSKDEYNHLRLCDISPRGLTGANLLPDSNQKMTMDTDENCISIDDYFQETQKVFGMPQNKKFSIFLMELNTNDDYSNLRKDIDWVYIKLDSFSNNLLQNTIHYMCNNYRVCIYMPPMIYERNCDAFFDEVDRIINTYEIKGIVLSNVGDLSLINKYDNRGLYYISGHHLHIYNHYTADRLMQSGINIGTYSLELPTDFYPILKRNTLLPLQQIVYGHLDLMHMKYCVLSHCNECINCGRCLDDEYNGLELIGENSFLVRINKNQTETILYSKTIYSANTTEIVSDTLRFDFLDEPVSQINAIIEDYKSGFFYTGSKYKNRLL